MEDTLELNCNDWLIIDTDNNFNLINGDVVWPYFRHYGIPEIIAVVSFYTIPSGTSSSIILEVVEGVSELIIDLFSPSGNTFVISLSIPVYDVEHADFPLNPIGTLAIPDPQPGIIEIFVATNSPEEDLIVTTTQILDGERVIGGEIIPIDTTSLLLAGVQTNLAWIIPIALSAVGVGIYLTKSRMKK